MLVAQGAGVELFRQHANGHSLASGDALQANGGMCEEGRRRGGKADT